MKYNGIPIIASDYSALLELLGGREIERFGEPQREISFKFPSDLRRWLNYPFRAVTMDTVVKGLQYYVDWEKTSEWQPDFKGKTEDIRRELQACYEQINSRVYKWFAAESGQIVAMGGNLHGIDILPPPIYKWNALKVLWVQDSKIRELPREIGALNSLIAILLQSDNLATLPSEIGHLPILEILHLCRTPLTSLPDSMQTFQKLRVLSLKGDAFDVLPSWICTLISLNTLRIGQNALKYLPPNIGHLVNLELLCANQNQLKSIPESIGSLEKLRYLDLSRNDLRDGSLPKSIVNLKFLKYLDLRGNDSSCIGTPEQWTWLEGLKRVGATILLPEQSFQSVLQQASNGPSKSRPFARYYKRYAAPLASQMQANLEKIRSLAQFIEAHRGKNDKKKYSKALNDNDAAWDLYANPSHTCLQLEFGLSLAERSIRLAPCLFNWDTKGCLLATLERWEEAKQAFLTALDFQVLPLEQEKISWGEFKKVLQKLGDVSLLSKYARYLPS